MAENLEIMIQRLVDGELNRHQIRELLHKAETDSSLYRNLALSMVEDQIWRREVTAMVEDHAETFSNASQASAASHNSSASGAATRNDSTWPWRQGITFFATAAAMLLMTWLGYRSGKMQGPASPDHSSLAVSESPGTLKGSMANIAPDSGTLSTDQPASQNDWDRFATHRIQFVSNDGHPTSNNEMSVIPYSTARELGVRYETQPIPVDVQRKYNNHGVELQPEIQYMRGRLSDGRQVIVPIQHIRAQPWGQ